VRLNDPALVRDEYASEDRLAARAAVYEQAEGPDARDRLLELLRVARPTRLLEVGCGWGELADRIAFEVDCKVVAVDLSPRMVELARERGVDATLADVQDLPFEDGEFDCAIAAWMLYHVPDLDRGLAELARVLRAGGRLFAITNSERHLRELWELVDGYVDHHVGFSAENGAQALERHFVHVERCDVTPTVVFTDRSAAHNYIASSVTRSHLADRLPPFEGPLRATRATAVFVAEKAP
jgi:ubiquinone/menaquinone biosynthesis C-methylase UbiE